MARLLTGGWADAATGLRCILLVLLCLLAPTESASRVDSPHSGSLLHRCARTTSRIYCVRHALCPSLIRACLLTENDTSAFSSLADPFLASIAALRSASL